MAAPALGRLPPPAATTPAGAERTPARVVCVVYAPDDGRVNLEAVERCYARAYSSRAAPASERFRKAEAKARAAGLGIWATASGRPGRRDRRPSTPPIGASRTTARDSLTSPKAHIPRFWPRFPPLHRLLEVRPVGLLRAIIPVTAAIGGEPLELEEALRLFDTGRGGVRRWNSFRARPGRVPSFEDADLEHVKLMGANLASVNFRYAQLGKAQLVAANLAGADLSDADLYGADLNHANLRGANLTGTNLQRAYLRGADLGFTHLGHTRFIDLDLSNVQGLEEIVHLGPSIIDLNTLARSKGRTPEAFLRGCGLAPWEVLATTLYDPNLTPPRFIDIQYAVFDAWTKGKDMVNGCFISYSWKDSNFADKLRDRLVAEGINVWLDRHDMIAGALQDQVWRAIQLHQVVILVLSDDSTRSDWVENELDMARRKEKAEGRAVLCPVALDDSWKAKLDTLAGPGDPSRALWRTLQQKLVMDFSAWKTKAFEAAFGKLVRGLKVNYGPKVPPTTPGTS